MDWLKKLLGDDLYNQVVAKIGTTKIIEDDGKLIPKHRFDEVSTKVEDLTKALQTAKDSASKVQKDFDDFKKSKESGSKTLEEQIATITKEMTTLKDELKNKDSQLILRDKKSAVETELRNRGANENYIQTLLREFEAKNPLDKVEVVEGKIKDAETIFKPFQENYKDLFGKVVKEGYTPKPGDPGYEPDPSKMTDAEYFANEIAKQQKK